MNANRLATRFEIAVANFVGSSFDLQANEKAYEADHSLNGPSSFRMKGLVSDRRAISTNPQSSNIEASPIQTQKSGILPFRAR